MKRHAHTPHLRLASSKKRGEAGAQTYALSFSDWDAAIEAKYREIAEALFQVSLEAPTDAPGIFLRALLCVAGGDAVALRFIPAAGALDLVGSLEFTDALLEIIPALRASDPDPDRSIVHSHSPSVDSRSSTVARVEGGVISPSRVCSADGESP